MIQTEKGYKFESTGKEIETFGVYGFSIFENQIRTGHDNTHGEYNEDKGFCESGLSDEEKKELAFFVIQEWCEFGGIKLLFQIE
jgi:hypothetical protein